jgi:hypothetical protein
MANNGDNNNEIMAASAWRQKRGIGENGVHQHQREEIAAMKVTAMAAAAMASMAA